MKSNLSGFTKSQVVIFFSCLIIFIFMLGLGFTWLLLFAWNLLASSAGFSVIPVTWLTVIATMILIGFVRIICRWIKY